ncbi:hypothetical protein SVIOM342S_02750 [Streptomyces violaceorubidus]
MSEPFSVPVTVRGYETDTQGHLNQSVYLNYAEHARWSLLQAAGIRQADLVARRSPPSSHSCRSGSIRTSCSPISSAVSGPAGRG